MGTMSESSFDPYEVLGVSPSVTDAELRRAYRDLVKRHHPDHNGGSPESTARFARIQAAYARLARARNAAPASSLRDQVRAADEDPGIERRIEDLERELAETRERERQARAAAQNSARQAAASRGAYQRPRQPTREELGYYETDDSFGKILDDAGAQLAEHLQETRRSEFTKRLTDLFRGRDEE